MQVREGTDSGGYLGCHKCQIWYSFLAARLSTAGAVATFTAAGRGSRAGRPCWRQARDAAATAAALNVTEPTSTGIGGDCFALYYEGRYRPCHRSTDRCAPAALTLDRLAREGFGAALPPFHAHTITVPCACAGGATWSSGTAGLRCPGLDAAIRLAEEGFPVAPITAHFWARVWSANCAMPWAGLEPDRWSRTACRRNLPQSRTCPNPAHCR